MSELFSRRRKVLGTQGSNVSQGLVDFTNVIPKSNFNVEGIAKEAKEVVDKWKSDQDLIVINDLQGSFSREMQDLYVAYDTSDPKNNVENFIQNLGYHFLPLPGDLNWSISSHFLYSFFSDEMSGVVPLF